MAAERLLDAYDVVILGTGVSEAMLSSALGRARHSVLHLDANGYYGDVWATKSLTEFVLWLSRPAMEDPQAGLTRTRGAVTTVHLRQGAAADSGTVGREWFWAPRLQDELEANRDNDQQEQARPDIRGDRPSRISLQQLVNQNRRFNLDISPKLTLGRSPLMELLHRTGLGFYSDIQRVGRCLHMRPSGRLVSLPVEPSAIDSWPRLADSERRAVSSFLHWCRYFGGGGGGVGGGGGSGGRGGASGGASLIDQDSSGEEAEENQLIAGAGASATPEAVAVDADADAVAVATTTQQPSATQQTLEELLEQFGITSALAKALIIENYAVCQPSTAASEGVARLQRFLRSLPPDSPEAPESPLAWVHYGSNEIAEVFCRHSAVWGATFILRRGVDSVDVEESRVSRLSVSGGAGGARDRVAVRQLVINARYAPPQWIDADKVFHVARAVFITDAPLRAAESSPARSSVEAEAHRGGRVAFLAHRLEGHRHPVRLVELPASTKACPPDTWVVHLTLPLSPGDATDSPRQALQSLASSLFAADEDDSTRPHALLSAFFLVKDYSEAVKHRSPNLPENVHLLPGADAELDFDCSVAAVDAAFRRLCPDKAFLPSTPPHSVSTESPLNATSY